MTEDRHVRICEGLGVKFPRATRPLERKESFPFEDYSPGEPRRVRKPSALCAGWGWLSTRVFRWLPTGVITFRREIVKSLPVCAHHPWSPPSTKCTGYPVIGTYLLGTLLGGSSISFSVGYLLLSTLPLMATTSRSSSTFSSRRRKSSSCSESRSFSRMRRSLCLSSTGLSIDVGHPIRFS